MDEKERLLFLLKKQGMNFSKKVIKAFKAIPREKFVMENYKERAYEDSPLPILLGQTISQPSTVLKFLDALDVKLGNKVLEIGSGSGYNTALLSKLVGTKGFIYSTEIAEPLAEFARNNIKKIKIKNVEILRIDGSQGLMEKEPFDRIILTVACSKIPDVLIDQLKTGGILVAPVGPIYAQNLVRLKKTSKRISEKILGQYQFVPMTGKYGY